MDVMRDAEAWVAGGDQVALATVVSVKRSAPRPPGTKMAVAASGAIAGAVSGGCVEGAVVEVADRVMAGEDERLVEFGITDEEAWDVGLQCGGEIAVWVERFAPERDQLRSRFNELGRNGRRGALITVVRGAGLGAKLLVAADGGRWGTLGHADLDAAAMRHAEELMWAERSELRDEAGSALFVDVTAPPPRIIVFGAVDYATPVCAMAKMLGWRAFVVDPRTRFAQLARFPDAEEVLAAWPDDAFARLGGIDRATAIVVLTHDPKLDDAALHIALRSDAGYVGAMGSRSAQQARRERLTAAGFTDEELSRIAAPVGLDLGALTPEETALSILGEAVAMRRGREGGRLSNRSDRIHVTTHH